MRGRVEFCGLPGSGKSTLCDGAVRILRARGWPALGRAEMVDRQLRRRNFGWLANTLAAVVPGWREAFLSWRHGMDDWLGFVTEHPRYAAQVHDWLAEAGRTAEWRRIVFHAVVTSAFERELAGGEDRPVLLDESFAQRYFSLRGYGAAAREGDAARYAEVMPAPGAVVWVSTDPGTCLARVAGRPNRPLLMRGEGSEALPLRFAEGAALLSGLAEALEARGVPVLRIEGDGAVEGAAERVADFAEGRE